MTNATPAAGTPAADPYLRWETLGGWSAQPDQRTLERERLESRAKGTDATSQLLRCFPSWTRALEQLTSRTLERLAANEPVDPNDPDGWRNRDAHAQAVLHRHGKGKVSATRLTSAAITALIDGQARPTATPDSTGAPSPRRRARSTSGWRAPTPRCPSTSTIRACGRISSISGASLARPLGLDDHLADDLSRWVLANPSQFDAGDLRCWRIGSESWLSLAGEQLGSVGTVERPVGVFVVPALGSSDGWQLVPVLALDTIRLVAELGGRVERDLRSAVLPIELPRGAARADQRAHVARRAEGVPGLGGAARAGALARAADGDQPGRAARQARPVGPARRPPPLLQGRRRHEHGRARAAGAHVPRARVHPAAARVGAARGAVRAPERGDGSRRGGADGGRRRAAAAALDRGRRRAEGHRPGRADEGPPGDAHDHHLRRRVGDHAAGGRRAGDRRAARAEARAGEGDARGRRAAGGADDARATAGRRPGAARPPARDGRAEGRRLRRRRVARSAPARRSVRPGARAPRLPRSRGSAGSSSPRAGCSASGARSSPAARPGAGCRRWRRTSSCSCCPTTGRSPGRSAGSTASSATGPGSCSRRTACSTATRPTCRRSRGTC